MRLDLELDDTFASDRHELCYMWSVQVIFNVRNKVSLFARQMGKRWSSRAQEAYAQGVGRK